MSTLDPDRDTVSKKNKDSHHLWINWKVSTYFNLYRFQFRQNIGMNLRVWSYVCFGGVIGVRACACVCSYTHVQK